ncbi:AIS_collapsed_G0004840.mRNA.1.CDS.1 [Saccharomyces cerevisiae]|nr:AIS_HP1_G0004760.mRNA.1.CDS.1 [Saccharomyces cerevisiae]CAI6510971.1 AIS_collapsed_G0004840.mRNA.1.CDS.1 [Saccharomyces cerevisiae]
MNEFEPKSFAQNDMEVEIENFMLCSSDTYLAFGNWGNMKLPLVVCHQIVGHVVKVGSKCGTGIKIGDHVGIGPQVLSCVECDCYKSNYESYCKKEKH